MALHVCHLPFPDAVKKKLEKYILKDVNMLCIVYYCNIGGNGLKHCRVRCFFLFWGGFNNSNIHRNNPNGPQMQ